MDKTEYRMKLDELTALVDAQDYRSALEVADSVDWKRVKSVRTLSMVADVYEVNRNYVRCKEILQYAYNRSMIGKMIVYRLAEVSLKLGEIEEADGYYREFIDIAPNDNAADVLHYRLLRAKKAPLSDQIKVLAHYKEKEYTERWAYELAKLYKLDGDEENCIETCDDLVLWFAEGKYVQKALELKSTITALSPSQQQLYATMEKTDTTGGARPASSDMSAAQMVDKMDSRAAQVAQHVTSERGGWNVKEKDVASAPLDSPEFLGKTVDLKKQLAKSIQEVFAKAEVPEDVRPTDDTTTIFNPDTGVIDISELEPEAVESEANPATAGGAKTVLTKVPGKTEGLPKDAVRVRQPSEEEKAALAAFDLDSLLKETASEFSRDINGKAAPAEHVDVAGAEAAGTADTSVGSEAVGTADATTAAEVAGAGDNAEAGADAAGVAVGAGSEANGAAKGIEAGGMARAVAAGVAAGVTGAAVAKAVKKETEAGDLEKQAGANGTALTGADAGEAGMDNIAKAAGDEKVNAGTEADVAGEAGTAAAEAVKTEAGSVSANGAIGTAEASAPTRVIPPIQGEAAAPGAEAGSVAAGGANAAAGTDAATKVIPSVPDEAFAQEADAANGKSAAEAEDKTKVFEPKREQTPDATREIFPEEIIQATKSYNYGKNTIPMSIDELMREETPEERRIRILNEGQPERFTDEQKNIFSYLARVPGIDRQVLEALSASYAHVTEKTSMHGNIAVMGAYGTGKTRLSQGIVKAMATDLNLKAVKYADIDAGDLNQKDPAEVAKKMAGGFLLIERAGLLYPEVIEKLNHAMEQCTDGLVIIIEDEKTSMRALLRNHSEFAKKFDTLISIPVFTNDELVSFARTYASENGYKIDEIAVLALYTEIGNNQTDAEPVTIAKVKQIMDKAIRKSKKKRFGRKQVDERNRIILVEKDFLF